jgi:hypothetical protein
MNSARTGSGKDTASYIKNKYFQWLMSLKQRLLQHVKSGRIFEVGNWNYSSSLGANNLNHPEKD